MCTRSYPECSVYGEDCGADGECDMDSSAENTNSSDSLDPTRQDRLVKKYLKTKSDVDTSVDYTVWSYMMKTLFLKSIWKWYILYILNVFPLFIYLFIFIQPFLYFLLCNPSHLIGSASASVISGEEQFEDYGEGEDVDFTPSSPCPEDDTRTNGFSDLGSSLPSRLVFGLETHPHMLHSHTSFQGKL